MKKLIAGQSAAICDECVYLCVEVLEEEAREVEQFGGPLTRLGKRPRTDPSRAGGSVSEIVAGEEASSEDPDRSQ